VVAEMEGEGIVFRVEGTEGKGETMPAVAGAF